jgi:hypothetical protein
MNPSISNARIDKDTGHRQPGSATLVILLVGAIAVSAIAMYAIQQKRLDDQRRALDTARTQLAEIRQDAVVQIAAARADAFELKRRIGTVRRESAGQLRLAQRRIDQLIASLEQEILVAPLTPLADGRYFVYVSAAAIGEHPRIIIDRARFLTGRAAERAAAERGDEVTDAYYIVNDEPDLSTLAFSADAVVRIAGRHTNGNATLGIDPRTWLRAVQTQKDVNDYGSISNGYWITVDGGQVVLIEEQWVP